MTQLPLRKLAVLVHADIVDSTALVQANEALAHQRILACFKYFSGNAEEARQLVQEYLRLEPDHSAVNIRGRLPATWQRLSFSSRRCVRPACRAKLKPEKS